MQPKYNNLDGVGFKHTEIYPQFCDCCQREVDHMARVVNETGIIHSSISDFKGNNKYRILTSKREWVTRAENEILNKVPSIYIPSSDYLHRICGCLFWGEIVNRKTTREMIAGVLALGASFGGTSRRKG